MKRQTVNRETYTVRVIQRCINALECSGVDRADPAVCEALANLQQQLRPVQVTNEGNRVSRP